jgi:hypothetical protein
MYFLKRIWQNLRTDGQTETAHNTSISTVFKQKFAIVTFMNKMIYNDHIRIETNSIAVFLNIVGRPAEFIQGLQNKIKSLDWK